MANNMTNLAALVGQTLVTARDLTIDTAGISYEARRRNPQESDFILPAGTQVQALKMAGARLECDAGGYGTVFLASSHVPESGTSYRSKSQGQGQNGHNRWLSLPPVIAADPEVKELLQKIEQLKAKKAAALAAEQKALALQALRIQLADMEATEEAEEQA